MKHTTRSENELKTVSNIHFPEFTPPNFYRTKCFTAVLARQSTVALFLRTLIPPQTAETDFSSTRGTSTN